MKARSYDVEGPSLRVQGELPHRPPPHRPERAIPARAGRTKCNGVRWTSVQGHPCACRENRIEALLKKKITGPSLRVQGELPASRLSE